MILTDVAKVVNADFAEAFIPTIEQEYEVTGYAIGSTGDNPSCLSVFFGHSAATRLEGEASYYRGLITGREAHARQVGYKLGLNGQFCDRPESVHRRFDRQFTSGWQAGADIWADREAIMAGWASDEGDWHGSEVIEAGQWYRAGFTRGGVE